MAFVMEAFDRRFLDRAVHPLDLTVGPGMVRLGEPMLNAIRLTDHVEAHPARPGGVAIAGLLGELDAIIGQDRVDAVGYGFEQMLEELPGRSPVSPVDQLSDRELAGAIDAHEQVELAFGGLHLGDIDVEEADRVTLEELPLGFVALNVRQTGDAVPLEASVQR